LSRAILYAAADPTTAVAEVFQEHRVIDRMSLAPELAAFTRTGRLVLLDVSPQSMWSIQAGAAAAMQFGDTDLCQPWSRAAYEDYPNIHGLAYLSTMTGRRAYALYERAQPLLSSNPMMRRRLAANSLVDHLRSIAHDLGNWPIV
jgi:RES domain